MLDLMHFLVMDVAETTKATVKEKLSIYIKWYIINIFIMTMYQNTAKNQTTARLG